MTRCQPSQRLASPTSGGSEESVHEGRHRPDVRYFRRGGRSLRDLGGGWWTVPQCGAASGVFLTLPHSLSRARTARLVGDRDGNAACADRAGGRLHDPILGAWEAFGGPGGRRRGGTRSTGTGVSRPRNGRRGGTRLARGPLRRPRRGHLGATSLVVRCGVGGGQAASAVTARSCSWHRSRGDQPGRCDRRRDDCGGADVLSVGRPIAEPIAESVGGSVGGRASDTHRRAHTAGWWRCRERAAHTHTARADHIAGTTLPIVAAHLFVHEPGRPTVASEKHSDGNTHFGDGS